jgi:NAD(P)-dependent dehydrogenase (short-subunit alcohol dehydrogenase family)
MSEKVLKGRIALVTGASRGVGRAAARALASEGAHVVALARTQGALEDLDDEIRSLGSTATLVPLDIRDFDALDRLSGAIMERWGALDVLIANAGVLGAITPLRDFDQKPFDEVVAVNITANWRLLRAMDPALRASSAGRVVAITSNEAWRTRPYWGVYAMSKAALESMMRAYAEETKSLTPIRVTIVNPGPMRTEMRRSARPGEDPMSIPAPDDLMPELLRFVQPAWAETGALYDFPSRRILEYRSPE